MSLLPDTKPKETVVQLNKLLASGEDSVFDKAVAERYFEAFKNIFNDFLIIAEQVQSSTLLLPYFEELCELNYLYAFQIKFRHPLPEELEQIAYDFDNPEYPGVKYNGILLWLMATNFRTKVNYFKCY